MADSSHCVILRVTDRDSEADRATNSSLEDICRVLQVHHHQDSWTERYPRLESIADVATKVLANDRASQYLVVEYLAPASGGTLSFLCAQLSVLLQTVDLDKLLISVPSVDRLRETMMLKHVYTTRNPHVFVADPASTWRLKDDGSLVRLGSGLPRSHFLPSINVKPLASDLHLRLGHFVADIPESVLHGNCVARIDVVAENATKWSQLVDATITTIRQTVGANAYVVLPIEWVEGELERLALEVCEGRVDRLWTPDTILEADTVCVSLASVALSLSSHRMIASKRGVHEDSPLRPVNLFGYGEDVPSVVAASTVARTSLPWECRYCALGAPIEGNGGPGSDIAAIHPAVFWDHVAWDASSASSEHFPSPFTANHFNLRVDTAPIFDVFGHALATRIVNASRSRGILQPWIEGIICTGGSERGGLVPFLAQRYRVSSSRTFSVTHEMRTLAQRPGMDPGLRELVARAKATGVDLDRRNVLIVDQAAHHLASLSAMRKVSEAFGARPLAFSVFMDRTGSQVEQPFSEANGMQFVPLYAWDCRPWRKFECPCSQQVEVTL